MAFLGLESENQNSKKWEIPSKFDKIESQPIAFDSRYYNNDMFHGSTFRQRHFETEKTKNNQIYLPRPFNYEFKESKQSFEYSKNNDNTNNHHYELHRNQKVDKWPQPPGKNQFPNNSKSIVQRNTEFRIHDKDSSLDKLSQPNYSSQSKQTKQKNEYQSTDGVLNELLINKQSYQNEESNNTDNATESNKNEKEQSIVETNIENQKLGLKASQPKVNRLVLLSKLFGESDEHSSENRTSSQNGQSKSAIEASLSTSSMGELPIIEEYNAYSSSSKLDQLKNLSQSFPTLKFDELNLKQVIGGGGFGQVWKGTWKGTPVAVKILSNICQQDILPDQLVVSFEEEVALLSRLRHPNICLFLGVCLDSPHRAIVTELVARGSLWDVLRTPGIFNSNMSEPWPNLVIRKIIEGTCRGLIYLHSHQPPIIHRDLKSANLLLDESFNIKICDFGLARLRDLTTVLTANVGTIQWMAPEVLTGNQYNESADIYSLGIVIWEIFTKKCPFDGIAQVEIAVRVVQRDLRPEIPDFCSQAQIQLLKKCWDRDPKNRYSAEEILDQLQSAFP